jgi:hypothetical protein
MVLKELATIERKPYLRTFFHFKGSVKHVSAPF